MLRRRYLLIKKADFLVLILLMLLFASGCMDNSDRIKGESLQSDNGAKLSKPSTVVMAYTGHSDYTRSDTKTFVVVGERDGIANPSVMRRRINALKSAGIDTEYHEYPSLGHGFGLGIGTSAEGWLNNAIKFWDKHISN